MLKTLCTLQLLILSTIGFSQRSKIDSVKVTGLYCYSDSLGDKAFFPRRKELATCSENSCHYKKWGYNFPDASIDDFQYEFTSSTSKEKLMIYWDHSYPEHQETTVHFEKYYTDNQTYKSLEIQLEKEVYRNAHKKDTLFARNVQSRQVRQGYQPNPFYLHDFSYVDTTIVRITIRLEVINEHEKKSLEMNYDTIPFTMQEMMDYVDGQTVYDIATMRSFFEKSVSVMENMELENERIIDFDANVLLEKFSLEEHPLYNPNDKKRPSYLKRRNKQLQRIKKDKNVEIREYNYGNGYEIEKYEVY